MSKYKYYTLEGAASCSVKVDHDDKILEFIDTTNTTGGDKSNHFYEENKYLQELISDMDWDIEPRGLKSPDEEGCKVTEISEEQFIRDKKEFSINNKIKEIRAKRSQAGDAQGEDPLVEKREILLSDRYAMEKATDDLPPDASDFTPEERIDPTKEGYSKMSAVDRQRAHDDHASRRFKNLKYYYEKVKNQNG